MRILSLALTVWLTACLASAADSLPRTHPLAGLQDLEHWSEPVQEGSRDYRAALAGKPAKVRLPAWWGVGIRPPTGRIYVIEVSYKDTLTAPAIAEVFGGLGRSLSTTELHRFGGANDGQWKVAQLPVSWDMVMLPKGKETAELVFKASVDLPISRLVVREAVLPADQVRWEAESRAWIARLQADKAAAVPLAPAAVPAIPEAFRNTGFVPFVRQYTEPIQRDAVPKSDEIGATVFLRMARNEFEPGTFGVHALQDLDGVVCTVSELTGPAGTLACEARLLTAEYALTKTKDGHAWKPQRLWNAFPASIGKGQSCLFMLDLRTLGEASRPGIYAGRITITAAGRSAVLPLQVEVLPLLLRSMDDYGLRMGGCCTGLPSAGEMRTMLDYNHNMVNLWIAGVCPGMRKDGERIELDFYYLDEWMRLAKERGQQTVVWFLGGNPNGYPETMSIERELYRTLFGNQEEYFKKMSSPEHRGRILPELIGPYRQFLRDLISHAQQAGWPELILTPFDEPAKWAASQPFPEKRTYAIGCGPWIRDHFKAACALIHEAVPGTKVYGSIHHNWVREIHGYNGRVGEVFLPDIDILCTNAIDEDHQLGDKVRAAGKQFWQYSGAGAGRYNFGFWFGAWDARGSLCWAYNWGPRFDVSNGSAWEYGWMSPFATIVSPEYVLFREAWDDRRYLEAAKLTAQAGDAGITALLTRIRAEVIADRDRGGQDKVEDFWEAGKTASKLDHWRKLLADAIIAAGK